MGKDQAIKADSALIASSRHHQGCITISLQLLLARLRIDQLVLLAFWRRTNCVMGIIAGKKNMLTLQVGDLVGNSAGQPARMGAIGTECGTRNSNRVA